MNWGALRAARSGPDPDRSAPGAAPFGAARKLWPAALAVAVGACVLIFVTLPDRRAAQGGPLAGPDAAAGALSGGTDSRAGAPIVAKASTPIGQLADQRGVLERAVARNPRDGRGWVLLAYARMQADEFEAAAQAFAKALAVSRRVAADPDVWCEYADAVGMAQGGSLAGRPTEFIQTALGLRPDHAKGLEMAGSAAYEQRDFSAAAGYWRRLLPLLALGSQRHAELTAAIARAARLGALQIAPAR